MKTVHAPPLSGKAQPNSSSKPVILLIDDDVVILNTVISILKADYSVRPFTSGEAALRYLAEHGKPAEAADLILLDHQMPGLSGLEMLRRLHSLGPASRIPTIFLSGALNHESEALALEMGAAGYIQKPITPLALLRRVRLRMELQKHRKRLKALAEEKTKRLNAACGKLKAREDITLDLPARPPGGQIGRTAVFVRHAEKSARMGLNSTARSN